MNNTVNNTIPNSEKGTSQRGVKRTHAQPAKSYLAAKRTFDVVSASCGILVLSPLLAGIAIAVKCTSPGPIIFRQQRYGKDMKPFTLYKFRTMKVETDPDVPASVMKENKSCLTPIGGFLRRSSLDELPQFANIVKGDMSVVGPRPIFLKEVERIEARQRAGVNDIRPGLTGLAQVNGRDCISMEQQVALDEEYRKHMSISMDLSVFVKTFGVVLKRDGITRAEDGGAPAEEPASAGSSHADSSAQCEAADL